MFVSVQNRIRKSDDNTPTAPTTTTTATTQNENEARKIYKNKL